MNTSKKIWSKEEFIQTMLKDTIKYQKQYGFELENGSAWNNEADAFRHAYMQTYLTLRFNDFSAKMLGDFHEKEGNKKHNQSKEEERMDLHNNEVGRQIGKEIRDEIGKNAKNPDDDRIKDIIARKVIEKMQEGKLILDLSGRRQPKKKLNVSPNNNSNKLIPEGCAGTYQVSGYTREDGTKIAGYTRTCGAKHLGKELYANKRMQELSSAELLDAIYYFV